MQLKTCSDHPDLTAQTGHWPGSVVTSFLQMWQLMWGPDSETLFSGGAEHLPVSGR